MHVVGWIILRDLSPLYKPLFYIILRKPLVIFCSPATSFLVIKSIANLGLGGTDEDLVLVFTKIIPSFIIEAIDETNHAPIIEQLFKNLQHKVLGQSSFSALLRYKENLKNSGKRNFDFYTRTVPDKQRKFFGLMCKNVKKSSNAYLVGNSDDFSYGIVENTILKKLSDKGNSNKRGEASDHLRYHIENTKNIQDLGKMCSFN